LDKQIHLQLILLSQNGVPWAKMMGNLTDKMMSTFYDGRVYVADYANHRIQIFDSQGNVYVADYGNDRIQKFTNDGKSL
jgi:hypothetical protein